MDMAEIDAIHAELQTMRLQQHDDMATILQRLSAVEALVASEAARCPYREDIARASNNREQIRENAEAIKVLESAMVNVRVQLGGIGVTMGTVGAVITSVIMKALGQ